MVTPSDDFSQIITTTSCIILHPKMVFGFWEDDKKEATLSHSSYRDSERRLDRLFRKMIVVSPNLSSDIETIYGKTMSACDSFQIDINKIYTFDDISFLTDVLTCFIPVEIKHVLSSIEERNKMILESNPDRNEVVRTNNEITKKLYVLENVIKMLRKSSLTFIDEKNALVDKIAILQENAERKTQKLNIYNIFLNACNNGLDNFQRTVENIKEHKSKDPKEKQEDLSLSQAVDKKIVLRLTLRQLLDKKRKPNAYVHFDDNDEVSGYNEEMRLMADKKAKEDQLLNELGAVVITIEQQGKLIGNELDKHLHTLNNTGEEMEKEQAKLGSLNKGLKKLLEEKSKMMCTLNIVGIIVVIVIILIIVQSTVLS